MSPVSCVGWRLEVGIGVAAGSTVHYYAFKLTLRLSRDSISVSEILPDVRTSLAERGGPTHYDARMKTRRIFSLLPLVDCAVVSSIAACVVPEGSIRTSKYSKGNTYQVKDFVSSRPNSCS